VGRTFEGNLSGSGLTIAIVVARFNEFINRRLLEGAQDALNRHGVSQDDVDVVWVPGSLELPVAAQRLAQSRRYNAIICLGTIIRGETANLEYVAGGASSGIIRTALDTGVPTIFGVLTADTVEQAIDRAGAKGGNRGYQAAVTAIEMANLMKELPAADL